MFKKIKINGKLKESKEKNQCLIEDSVNHRRRAKQVGQPNCV